MTHSIIHNNGNAGMKSLKRRFSTTLWITWLLATMTAQTSIAQTTEGRLTLSGRGEILMTPDQAELRLTISERGASLDPLRASTDQTVARLIEALRKLSVADKDIDAAQISIQPIFRYDQPTQRRISEGYEVSRTVTVMIRDLNSLGTVIGTATSVGVNQISPPQLSSSQHERAYQQALSAAVTQSRARAVVVASAAGLKLTGIESISASDYYAAPMPMARVAMAADTEAGSYQPGEMTVSANVSITYTVAPQ